MMQKYGEYMKGSFCISSNVFADVSVCSLLVSKYARLFHQRYFVYDWLVESGTLEQI